MKKKSLKSILSSVFSAIMVILLILGFTGKLDNVASNVGYGKDDKESTITTYGDVIEVSGEGDDATVLPTSKLSENTWIYEEETYIKCLNINTEEQEYGYVYIEGFVIDYAGNLLEEHSFDKTFYVEEVSYLSEDETMEIYFEYMQVTDYETGFYDGYYYLNKEVTELVTEEEIKAFFRDTDNIGEEIGIVLYYSGDALTYHTFYAANVDGFFSVDTNKQSTILFSGDLVYVEGIYKGLDDLGNPYLELTQFSLMEPVE